MSLASGDVAAVVLAGGKSSRMGSDKAVLDFCGRRMIEVVVDRMRMLTDRIVVVTRSRRVVKPAETVIIEDESPFAGPLPALIAGLRAAGTERVVVVACDMPFLDAGFLGHLVSGVGDLDACVPITAEGPEPLHAAYGACAVEPLLAATAAGERSLRGALQRLKVRWVEEPEWRRLDPSGRSLLNLNTPEEWEAAAATLPAR
jgi:molybdopterin-guanine dinucleotide biosynthesis protein A